MGWVHAMALLFFKKKYCCIHQNLTFFWHILSIISSTLLTSPMSVPFPFHFCCLHARMCKQCLWVTWVDRKSWWNSRFVRLLKERKTNNMCRSDGHEEVACECNLSSNCVPYFSLYKQQATLDFIRESSLFLLQWKFLTRPIFFSVKWRHMEL